MVVGPGIKVKAVEANPLRSNGDDRHAGAYFPIEAILVHPEIGGRIPESNDSRSSHAGLCRPRTVTWSTCCYTRQREMRLTRVSQWNRTAIDRRCRLPSMGWLARCVLISASTPYVFQWSLTCDGCAIVAGTHGVPSVVKGDFVECRTCAQARLLRGQACFACPCLHFREYR